MQYTERDLEIARRNVVVLMRLIKEHRAIARQLTFDADLKARAEQLLSQFEASLRDTSRCYGEIWWDLHSAGDSSLTRRSGSVGR
jgi:hypothetical protein